MAAIPIKQLFDRAVSLAGRSFPTETMARANLRGFKSVVEFESSPVNNVLKQLLGRASVQRMSSQTGEDVFKIFVRFDTTLEDCIGPVLRGLRKGDLDSVARAMSLTTAELGWSKTFRTNYSAYVRNIFPDVRIAEQAVAAEKALPAALSAASKSLRPETAEQLLQAIRRDAELEKIVNRLSKHVRANGGSKFKYVSTFFALGGVSGAVGGVVAALHEQAKRSAGCWRIYLDPVTKEMRSCKILHASCRHKEANERSVCDSTPLSFHPRMCEGMAEDDECASCDPTAPPDSRRYLSPTQQIDPNDLYVCRPVASVGEMLGRLIADMPELARDVVTDVTGTVFRAWDSVKWFVLAIGSLVAVVVAMYVFVVFRRRRAGGWDDSDADDGEKIHLLRETDYRGGLSASPYIRPTFSTG